MTTHHGKDGHFNIGADKVAESTEWSVTESVETAEDTAQGDLAKTHLVGIPEWEGSATVHWDPTDTNGQLAMTIGAELTFNGYPMGDASGNRYMSGQITVTEIGTTVPIGDRVSTEFSFQGNGVLTHDTVSP